jgi:hypothetical protein
MSASPQRLPHAVNDRFIEFFTDLEAGPVADDATFTITLPTEFRGRSPLPILLAAVTYGAGAVGARTATYQALDQGAAGTGVQVTTFVEATGVLTLTNRSGGPLSAVRLIFLVVDDVQ